MGSNSTDAWLVQQAQAAASVHATLTTSGAIARQPVCGLEPALGYPELGLPYATELLPMASHRCGLAR
jgi:hypothetical protein